MATTVEAVETKRPDGLIESHLVFKGYQDGDVRAYRVRPDVNVPQPGIVVIPEWRGLLDEIRELGRRLAKAGYVALVIEPFSRNQEPIDLDDMNQLAQRMQALSDVMAVGDVQAAAKYLRSLDFVNGERIGTIGFCMGGLYSRLAACTDESLTCAVEYYGMVKYAGTSEAKPTQPIDMAKDLHCPYVGFFGAKDEFVPLADVREMEQVFRAEDKDAIVEVYDKAGHAFLNEERELYVEAAAKDAWRKTLAFFTQHLRGE